MIRLALSALLLWGLSSLPAGQSTAAANGASLRARCTFEGQGWSSVLAGLRPLEIGGAAEALAMQELGEHARLHGWPSDLRGPDTLHGLLEPPCPAQALADFRLAAAAPPSWAEQGIYSYLAYVFERNHDMDSSRRLLRSFPAELSSSFVNGVWERLAHLELHDGNWQTSLDALDRCEPDGECGLAADWQTAHWDSMRARCLLELGRGEELEDLLLEHFSDGACVFAELVVEGWSRGIGSRSIERLQARVRDRALRGLPGPWDSRLSGVETVCAQIASMIPTAEKHVRILAMPTDELFEHLHELSPGFNNRHVNDVLDRVALLDANGVDRLLRVADEVHTGARPGGLAAEKFVLAVVAGTGDSRVEVVLRARLASESEEQRQAAACSMTEWYKASALRKELAEAR